MPKPSRPYLLLTLLAAALFAAVLVHRGCRPAPPPEMGALADRLRAAGLTVYVVSPAVCYVTDHPTAAVDLPAPYNLDRHPEMLPHWRGIVYCQKGKGEYGVPAGPWTLSGDPATVEKVVRALRQAT